MFLLLITKENSFLFCQIPASEGAVLGYEPKDILVYILDNETENVATIDATNEKMWKIVFQPVMEEFNDKYPSNSALFKVNYGEQGDMYLSHRRFMDERILANRKVGIVGIGKTKMGFF